MRHHTTNIAVSILSELFSGSIVCWGNILLDVIQWLCFCASRTQGGPGGCSTFGSVAWRGCAIWQETYVELIISGCSGRTNGNKFLYGADTRGNVKHGAVLCFTQQVFSLRISFQLAWHVRDAALPHKPVQHSKHIRTLWQTVVLMLSHWQLM